MNTLERWHAMLESRDLSGLDDLLDEGCIFYSPIVHSPQVGRELTKFYLTGAFNVFNETFRYVKEVVTPTHAVLEFECELEGISINGVDIITFNDAGQITEFKVMVRPLKAVNLLHAKMKAMLEQMSA